MAAVHYYLGRPARVWISARFTPTYCAASAKAADASTAASPASPQPDSPLRCPPQRTRLTRYLPTICLNPDGLRDRGTRPSPGAAPAYGLLARRRIAIARFGTDVAAAGGIGPALAAGLDPPWLPGRARRRTSGLGRAQVYPGLCERYQELYQAQLAESPPDGNGAGMHRPYRTVVR